MQSCWPTAFDLIKLCTGTAADLGLHSDTVQTVCRQFIASRDAKRDALGSGPAPVRAANLDGLRLSHLP